jgi:hypothetical protein
MEHYKTAKRRAISINLQDVDDRSNLAEYGKRLGPGAMQMTDQNLANMALTGLANEFRLGF